MFHYETGELTISQKENFVKFLGSEIGTEYECDNSQANKFIITVFDLTEQQKEHVRKFETSSLNIPYEKFCYIFQLKNNDAIFRTPWIIDYNETENIGSQIALYYSDNGDCSDIFNFRTIEPSEPKEQYNPEAISVAIEIDNDFFQKMKNLATVLSFAQNNTQVGVKNVPAQM